MRTVRGWVYPGIAAILFLAAAASAWAQTNDPILRRELAARNADIFSITNHPSSLVLAAGSKDKTVRGNELPSIRFLWSFCALSGPENRPELIAITKDTVLHSGDQIKMLLQPVSACYLYVLYYSSQGELTILFPASFAAPEIPAVNQYLIPAGEQWFRLDDHTGPETFYLIASINRLAHLEDLIGKHLAPTSAEDSAISTNEIISEMKRLRRQYLKLAAPAERPVRLGGNLRGGDERQLARDIRRFAVEISAQDFFSRTFTIDHQ